MTSTGREDGREEKKFITWALLLFLVHPGPQTKGQTIATVPSEAGSSGLLMRIFECFMRRPSSIRKETRKGGGGDYGILGGYWGQGEGRGLKCLTPDDGLISFGGRTVSPELIAT